MPTDHSLHHHREISSRMHGIATPLWAIMLTIAAWRGGTTIAADPPEIPMQAVLDLPKDGFLVGTLRDHTNPGSPLETILWQSPAFTGPYEFALDCIRGIRFPLPVGAPPAAAGARRVEFVDGDAIVGQIESLDDEHLVAKIGPASSPRKITVPRDHVRRIVVNDVEDSFWGPGAMAGWIANPPTAWTHTATGLSGIAGSTISRNIGGGPRCRYDLALSWTERPTVQLTVASAGVNSKPAYRLELGPAGMLAVREEQTGQSRNRSRADLERFGDLPEKGVTVTLFIDQRLGRMAVVLPGVEAPVADLVVPPVNEAVGDGFRIMLKQGDLTLESLRVSPWKTDTPDIDAGDRDVIRLRDGTVIAKRVVSLDQPAGVMLDRIAEISFANAGPTPIERRDHAPRSIQVTDLWGSQLTGGLERVEGGAIVLSHPLIDGSVSLPIDTLATLTTLHHRDGRRGLAGRLGRLESDLGTMFGCLMPTEPDGHGSAIGWQPAGSLNPRALAVSPEGTPPVATVTYGGSRPSAANAGDSQPFSEASSLLVLRTGETLPCRVESIDAAGVQVRVEDREQITVPQSIVQALELMIMPGEPISTEKFRSLTMLPRSQEENPPTHIVRSRAGDYLRGRLVSVDATTVEFEVDAGRRGRPLRIARKDVARLIWLHPENLSTPWRPPKPLAGDGLLIDAVTGGTSRLRLWATGIKGNLLRGTNPSIGPCVIDLADVTTLTIGGAEAGSQAVPFAQWRLTLAPDPRNLPARKRPTPTSGAEDEADGQPDPDASVEEEAAHSSAGTPIPSATDLLAEAERLDAAGDRRAVAAYARLLTADDRNVRGRSIARLKRITGMPLPYGIDEAVERREAQATGWRRWAARHAVSATLRFSDEHAASWGPPRIGRLLVGLPGANAVVEYDENGTETFRVGAVQPWACDGTPDGHRLIGSYGGKYIAEHDETGREISRFANLESGVMSVRRLENGNTLATLADANKVVEFDPRGQRVWEVSLAGRPCDARRLADGRTLVALHKANRIVEVDEAGSEIWAVENLPDPQTVQRLPNGNTLVALTTAGTVREIDRDGREVWSREGYAVLVDAQRLPDGHTLLLEQGGSRIELDADGNEISRTGNIQASRLSAY